MHNRRGEVLALLGAGLLLASLPCLWAQGHAEAPEKLTREQVIDQTMTPFQGTSEKGVDRSTLKGKVMCGYQGWHAAEGDGCGRGWYHWAGRNGFRPGSTNVDLWPDVSELGPDERYATPFRTADGKAAEVYSAFNAKTVLRHFQWMQDYGIDGVFVQRFAVEVFGPPGLRQFNTVLDHCREGANKYGRTYAVMYDLSGMKAGQMDGVKEDWKLLTEKMRITEDPAYLHHNGKPVVAVWGFGFNDGRKYTPKEGLDLVAHAGAGCRPRRRAPGPDLQGRRRESVDGGAVRHAGRGGELRPEDDGTGPRLVQAEGKGVLARRVPGLQLAQPAPAVPAEFDPAPGRQVPVVAVRRREEGGRDDGLSGHVRRGGRGHGDLQMHQRRAGRGLDVRDV
jgi:hypothetical protein